MSSFAVRRVALVGVADEDDYALRSAGERSGRAVRNHLSLPFPGPAPSERGASASEKVSANLADAKPPQLPMEAEQRPNSLSAERRFARSVTAFAVRAACKERSVWRTVAMICAARNEAHGFRVESGAEGRQRSEDCADDRFLPLKLGSLHWR